MRLPVLSILIVLSMAVPAAAGEEFIERVATEWYEMEFLGKRLGYKHDYVNLVRLDGEEVWKIYRKETFFRKGADGLDEFSTTYIDYVTKDFTLIRALQIEDDAGQVKTTNITVTGNTAHVTVKLLGRTRSFTMPVVPGTVTATSGFHLWKSDLLRENTRVRVPIIVFEERKVFTEVVEIGSSKEVVLDNKPGKQYYARSTRPDLVGLVTETTYAEDGSELYLKMGKMELRESTFEDALKPLADDFDNYNVTIDVQAHWNEYLNAVWYKDEDGIRRNHFNAAPFAEFLLEVKVEGVQNASSLFEPHPGSKFINASFVKLSQVMPIIEGDTIPDDVKVFLEPSLTVQSDEPEFADAVKRILGGEKLQPVDAAERFMAWIHTSMRSEMSAPVSKTALTALHDLTGDCTEHSVLFVALCRASGIPARGVIGLLFENGKMTYHQWAEIYAEGNWIPCDPTRPSHPALGTLPVYLAICLDREDRAGANHIYRQTALQGFTTVRLVSGLTMDGKVIDFTKPKKPRYRPRQKIRRETTDPNLMR